VPELLRIEGAIPDAADERVSVLRLPDIIGLEAEEIGEPGHTSPWSTHPSVLDQVAAKAEAVTGWR
jgi:hypothetical protein